MVTLVNCFEIPPGSKDGFFSLWRQVNDYMRGKRGYLGHKLHRSIAPHARFRCVNVAQWASESGFRTAHDEGFRGLVGKPGWAPFRLYPTLYEIVHEGTGGTTYV